MSDGAENILPERKPKSPLDKLSPRDQAKVIQWLIEKDQVEVCKLIEAEHGFSTSPPALSAFWTRYRLRMRRESNASVVDQALEMLKEHDPSITIEKLKKAGAVMFSAMAIDQGKVDDWATAVGVTQKDEALSQSRTKLQRETCELFLEWFENKTAREIASSSAPNSEKIEKLGRTIFGDLWG